jgi:hypothetical protein
MRKLIQEADPDVVEEWKWMGTPVWSHDGILCTGESYKQVVKLTFAKGASLKDPARSSTRASTATSRRAIDIHEARKSMRPRSRRSSGGGRAQYLREEGQAQASEVGLRAGQRRWTAGPAADGTCAIPTRCLWRRLRFAPTTRMRNTAAIDVRPIQPLRDCTLASQPRKGSSCCATS